MHIYLQFLLWGICDGVFLFLTILDQILILVALCISLFASDYNFHASIGDGGLGIIADPTEMDWLRKKLYTVASRLLCDEL